MGYDKQTWVDGPGGGTPINATRLQHFEDGLDAAADVADSALAGLAGKSATGHTHTSPSITDFTEAVQDIIGAAIVAGPNVTAVYNDTTGTITISGTGGGGGGTVDDEGVRDTIAAALVAGSGIGIVVDDVANTITISSTTATHSHLAANVSFVPSGTISAANVQTAIEQAAATSDTMTIIYASGAYPATVNGQSVNTPPSTVRMRQFFGPVQPSVSGVVGVLDIYRYADLT